MLNSWKANRYSDPNTTKQVLTLYDVIGNIASIDDNSSTFTEIFNKHKNDETLKTHLDELISALRKILEEGDDVLTKQMADELTEILQEIEKRKKNTLFDIGSWVEWSLVSLASIIDSTQGVPVGAAVASGIMAAKKSNLRIRELASIAKEEYLNSLLLKNKSKFNSENSTELLDISVEEWEERTSHLMLENTKPSVGNLIKDTNDDC